MRIVFSLNKTNCDLLSVIFCLHNKTKQTPQSHPPLAAVFTNLSRTVYHFFSSGIELRNSETAPSGYWDENT